MPYVCEPRGADSSNCRSQACSQYRLPTAVSVAGILPTFFAPAAPTPAASALSKPH